MKLLSILLMSILLGFQAFGQSVEMRVDAIGLVVSDLQASEEFYTGILGMEASGGFELSEEWSKEAGMSNGRPFGVKMFRMEDDDSATILKLAYFQDPVKKRSISGIGQNAGVNYLTFYYSSLKEVKERIKSAGIPIVGEVDKPTYSLLIIRDPDGIFVELIKRK